MDQQPNLARADHRRDSPRYQAGRGHGHRLSRIALDLDEGLQRAWSDVVSEVRATADLKAILALQRFQLALEAFHNRPR